MFCKNCGKELPTKSKFCPECGEKVGAEENNDLSAERESGESILMKGLCNRVKNPLCVQNGKAILTNSRLVYLKHGLLETFTIGVLVNLTEGSYDFDLPLANIMSIEDGRQGISKTIIFNMKNGDKYNFYFTNRDEWKMKIQSAIDNLSLTPKQEKY